MQAPQKMGSPVGNDNQQYDDDEDEEDLFFSTKLNNNALQRQFFPLYVMLVLNGRNSLQNVRTRFTIC
jgi:hypothetical protein